MVSARIIPARTVTVALEDVTADLVCFEYALSVLRDRRQAGRLQGYVEATLAANPGLAGSDTMLPLGQTVHLPEFVIEAEAGTHTVRLWDL